MMSQKWFLGAALALIVVLVFSILWVNQDAPEVGDSELSDSKSSAVASLPAKELPEFQLKDSISAGQLGRDDILGEKMLLNVWATWCVACRQEHGFLHELAHQGVKIVGLNYRDRPQAVEEWFAELGNPYKVNLLDMQGKLGGKLPVVGAPETYLIDRNGVIRHKHSGIIDKTRWDLGLVQIYDAME